jgi:DNA-binding MarR family transcriptional regulator
MNPAAINPLSKLTTGVEVVKDVNSRKTASKTEFQDSINQEVRKILEDFRLEDVASHLLRRAHFFAEDLFAQEFTGESLTPRQKAALISIYQHPGQNQKTLAERLFMDHNTVAEMIARLVGAGLLSRINAKEDKRAYQLSLTQSGALLLNKIMPRDMEVERRLLERLPEEYRPLFLKCLRLIIAAPTSSEDS